MSIPFGVSTEINAPIFTLQGENFFQPESHYLPRVFLPTCEGRKDTMVDRITDLARDAMLGETSWRHFLKHLASIIPDGTAALVVHDTRSGNGYGVISGHGEKAMEPYNRHYAKMNPLQAPLAMQPVGVPAIDDDLLPRNELMASKFFNDFLVPHDMTHSTGMKIASSNNLSFTLTVGYVDTRPEPLRKLLASLEDLAPCLHYAFRFYQRKRQQEWHLTRNVLNMMDRPNTCVIALNDELRAIAVTQTAHAMLSELSLLRIFNDGRAHFWNKSAQRLCERMLERNYAGPTTAEFHSNLTRMTLTRTMKNAEQLYFEGPTVIVLIERYDVAANRFDTKIFSDAYGLSKGEARALSGIVAGHSVDQIASRASRSRETIRSQTKSLYSKMGVTCVADVLRLVHQGALHDHDSAGKSLATIRRPSHSL